MTMKFRFEPTGDQNFRLVGRGEYDFVRTLERAQRLQAEGRIDEACEERFAAFRRLVEILPEEPMELDCGHANSRAALELLYCSAVDHFWIEDFELSAAMLEQLLELDPEDHLEGVTLLAVDYLALGDGESFDAVRDDLADGAVRDLLIISAAVLDGRQPDGEVVRRFRSRHAAWLAEWTAAEHPADGVAAVDAGRSTPAAEARAFWLRTQPLWRAHPEVAEALRRLK